jgi:hypothetical protein
MIYLCIGVILTMQREWPCILVKDKCLKIGFIINSKKDKWLRGMFKDQIPMGLMIIDFYLTEYR